MKDENYLTSRQLASQWSSPARDNEREPGRVCSLLTDEERERAERLCAELIEAARTRMVVL
jgi:hypothetical protein